MCKTSIRLSAWAKVSSFKTDDLEFTDNTEREDHRVMTATASAQESSRANSSIEHMPHKPQTQARQKRPSIVEMTLLSPKDPKAATFYKPHPRRNLPVNFDIHHDYATSLPLKPKPSKGTNRRNINTVIAL